MSAGVEDIAWSRHRAAEVVRLQECRYAPRGTVHSLADTRVVLNLDHPVRIELLDQIAPSVDVYGRGGRTVPARDPRAVGIVIQSVPTGSLLRGEKRAHEAFCPYA